MVSDVATLFDNIFRMQPESPSLQQLEQVADRFALIPYENITKIIRSVEESGESAIRNPEDVLGDFKLHGAGGTCFSLTFCMQAVLVSNGYSCTPRMADLGNRRNNHCALVVTIHNCQYLIDPGYLITRPLPIPESGSVLHETRLHPVRLVRDISGNSLHLSTLEPLGEKYRYRLHPEAIGMDQFKHYWIDSFSWPMMNSLLVTRALPDGRFYLHDRYIGFFNRNGRKTGKIKEHFDQTLAMHSGINPILIRQAREILAKTKKKLMEKDDI